MWLMLIILHSVAGVAALAVGLAALQPHRLRRYRWLPALLVWLIVALVVFMVGAMAAHWRDLAGAEQLAFSGLAGLGVYMTHRAWRARTAAVRIIGEVDADPSAYMDDIGFILISLFDGFTIVTALDLGAPAWLVAALAVLAVLAGHHAIARVKSVARSDQRTGGFDGEWTTEPTSRR